MAIEDGGTVPASAPGLLVSAEPDVAFQLFDATLEDVGGTVAREGARQLFVPNAPLVPGTYTLVYPMWGEPRLDTPPPLGRTTFTATRAIPLPTKTGRLGVQRASRQMREVSTSSRCEEVDDDVGVVDLALELDTALEPYSQTLAWELHVATPSQPPVIWAEARGRLVASRSARHPLRLFTSCDRNRKTDRDYGLPAEGIYDIALRPILVGSATSIAPASMRVTVSCGADNGNLHLEGSDNGGSPGTTPTSRDHATEDSSSSSGCATAPTGGPDSGATGIAVAVVLALRVARRRR